MDIPDRQPHRKLRILMLTVPFFPMVGGLETVAAMLAEEMAALGQDVTLLTLAPGRLDEGKRYKVLRRPSFWKFMQHYLRADCVLIHGITLQLGWPSLFRPSSTVVIHHGFCNLDQPLSLMRRLLLRGVKHVAVSKAVSASIPGQVQCIYNPYNSTLFRPKPVSRSPGSLLFVGRLVREKGPEVLIEAMAILKRKGLEYALTIVGDGPCRDEIAAAVRAHGLQDQVRLTGPITGEPLADLMNSHHVVVIPSLWAEPFGIVAVEAIACGCEVVGTNEGGLPEAIGPCGITVPNGSAEALANAIETAVRRPRISEEQEKAREAHLRQFQPGQVALSYLKLFRQIID
jgi:glycogen(starch) synthase